MPAISSIHPRSCLQGSDLHHRADVFRRIAASVLIGQIKKTKIHACHCSSPRVSGQTDSGMSLHDVQRSGRGHFAVSTQPNLLSFLRRKGSEFARVRTICACHSSIALMAFASQIVPPERFALRDDLKWWSQTGSNRRHPACKAGALPAELWPQT